MKPVFGLIKSITSGKTIASCYWRKRAAVPSNPGPDRDGCGLLWCAPVASAETKKPWALKKAAVSASVTCSQTSTEVSEGYCTRRKLAGKRRCGKLTHYRKTGVNVEYRELVWLHQFPPKQHLGH